MFERPWVWNDDEQAPVRLARWRGRPMVVAFVYTTTCTTVCPLTIERLRQVDSHYQKAGRAVEMVLVTLDPWTDNSAAQLRQFRSTRHLPTSWHLLRAPYPQTRALAELLQVRLIDEGGHVIHDGTVSMIDGEGRPVGHLAP